MRGLEGILYAIKYRTNIKSGSFTQGVGKGVNDGENGRKRGGYLEISPCALHMSIEQTWMYQSHSLRIRFNQIIQIEPEY